MNIELSFLRGMVASINPCAFVLLPTYLVYFLGVEAEHGGSQRASVRRALVVSAAVSAGFMGVFVVAGILSNFVTTLAQSQRQVRDCRDRRRHSSSSAWRCWPVASCRSRRRSSTAPAVTARCARCSSTALPTRWPRSVARSASSHPSAFTSPDSFVDGVVNVVAYGLGMALVVTALTVTLAVANHALLRVLRSAMRYANQLAAAFVLLSGLYLLYYFWVVDVNGESDAITNAVEGFQNDVLVALSDNWQLAALVLGGVVAAAVVYVTLRRRPTRARR